MTYLLLLLIIQITLVFAYVAIDDIDVDQNNRELANIVTMVFLVIIFSVWIYYLLT